jgi:hypothetical protein
VGAAPVDPGGREPARRRPGRPICNDPSLGGGRSDLAPGIPIQDAIDKLCADMLVASEFAAFRSASSRARAPG